MKLYIFSVSTWGKVRLAMEEMEVEEKNVAKEEQFIPDYQNVVGQDSLTRFDKTKRKKKKNRKNIGSVAPQIPSRALRIFVRLSV